MVPGTGIEPVWPRGRGILSPLCLPISPSGHGRQFAGTARACVGKVWRRDPESNWGRRICNPLHGHYAIAPKTAWGKRFRKKGKADYCRFPFFEFWSGRRVSNSRPIPWQGIALPTELLPQNRRELYRPFFLCQREPTFFHNLIPLAVASGPRKNLRPCHSDVVDHRPERQHCRDVDEPGAGQLRIKHAQRLVVKQQRNGDHLGSSL